MTFPLPDPQRHWGCRVNDRVVWDGFRAMIIQNELIQVVILVDKGAEIVQFLYKPLDIDFLWRSPNRLRAPGTFVPIGGESTSPFFDRWSGGWFEVLPNGGTACQYSGASFGFFAETINLPWEYRILEDTPERVSIGLWVSLYRTPLLLRKTITLKANSPALMIDERVENTGNETVEFMWGHHPVIGAPFLSERCRLSAPACEVQVFHDEDGPDYRMRLHQTGTWPIIADRDGNPLDLRALPPQTSRTMDNCYLKNFADGWVAVENPDLRLGFGLAWDANTFRYVWMWQALGGGIGYPWHGRTYAIGLEPWTSYPCAGLTTAVENGTARQLAPGAHLTGWLTAVAFVPDDYKRDIRRINRDGTVDFALN